MSTSVGQVHLDVGLNQNGLRREINGLGKRNKRELQQAGKSLGKTLGGTFSVAFGNIISNLVQQAVRGLGNLVTSSIELGSSIAELENVTSTVFPAMTGEVEAFSKTAIQQYGLTEMQAKKMVGTFGAMAQAFNYSEREAYKMSESLTGLVGDVASFYNLDHDVAYTKIKSVFTGETESLKELGIVMTQTSLDEFAMRQGMGKTTKEMSEQEKVALRLAFVTDKLSFAQGDFAKTQHQWANQTRILSGQWDSFKAALGQGFIAVLTPVIQKLNELMAVVVRLGEKFRDFIMTVTGQSGSGSGAGALMLEISDVTTAAADTAETAADTATSAAKEVKKSVMGFDKLNKLAAPDTSYTGSGSTSISMMPSTAVPKEEADKANSMLGVLDDLKAKLNSLANWTGLDKLWANIKAGVDTIDFSAIKSSFTSIMGSLKPIGEAAFNGFGEMLRSKMSFFGTIIGGIASITGKSIEIATGGIAKWLEAESPKIAAWITENSTKVATGFDNLSFSSEKIFGLFWKALDENQEVIEDSIANVLTSISDVVMTIGTILADMWLGLTEGLKSFVTEEEATISGFFNGIIETVTGLSNTISNIISGLFASIREWWENDGKRVWNEIVEVFYDLVAWVTEIWNNTIKPVIDAITQEIDRLWAKHIKPLWDNFLAFITSLWDAIKAVYDWLKPVIDWLIKNVGPAIADAFKTVVRVIGMVIGTITDVVSGIITSLRGILDFITGVFTGDWEKAWNGIRTFFKGIWESIWGAIKGTINLIIEGLNTLWSGLYSALSLIVNGVGGLVSKLGEAIGKDWGFSMPKNAPMIPRLAEGGFVRANQPQLAVIGDNKRQGEIVAPEDKLYEIVSRALQTFMGQLIAALNASGGTNKKADEAMQLIIQLGEETIVNRLIKRINAESRRQGFTVIKV